MQMTVELDFLEIFAQMYWNCAHTRCKQHSQTKRAAATRCLPIKLPLILLWLFIYLVQVLWLPFYHVRLSLSLCFSSTATHGLLLLSPFEPWAVPLFHLPEASRQIEPSPPHHRQLPPMLGFSLLLMSNFSPAHETHPLPWLWHHQLESPPTFKTL